MQVIYTLVISKGHKLDLEGIWDGKMEGGEKEVEGRVKDHKVNTPCLAVHAAMSSACTVPYW